MNCQYEVKTWSANFYSQEQTCKQLLHLMDSTNTYIHKTCIPQKEVDLHFFVRLALWCWTRLPNSMCPVVSTWWRMRSHSNLFRENCCRKIWLSTPLPVDKYTSVYIHTKIYTYILTYLPTYIHAYIDRYIHILMYVCTFNGPSDNVLSM